MTSTADPANGAELSTEELELLSYLLEEETVGPGRVKGIPRRGELERVPLSFAQERLWFLDQLEPESSAYNVPAAYRVTGPLNATALEEGLTMIVNRHEILRTTFSATDGLPFQVIAPSLAFSVPVVDLQALPEAEREAEALRLVRMDARRPFDLAHGPLLRASLIRLRETEHILILNMHHIVCDAWSADVLFRELAILYEAFVAGNSPRLEELPIQYADYAVWQREWLQGKVLETQLGYWKEKLSGAPASPPLPTDQARPATQTNRGAHESLLLLPASRMQALQTLSRQEAATLFMILLAAFEVLLYRYTGQEDIVVGTPIANRSRAEMEALIGFFLNTLVLRTDLTGEPTFRELLGRVREVVLDAYTHQDLPFEKLVEELRPERDPSHSPLFQVMFVYVPGQRRTREMSGLVFQSLNLDGSTSKFDLTLSMRDESEGLTGALAYNTDLFEAATMQRMLGHLKTLLEGIVEDPDRRISRLPLLSVPERDRMLVEWNDTQTDFPQGKSIHELFEAQVERSAGMPAVVYEDEMLTYGELNKRANQLAHHLQELGVGPEVLVGICAERSLEWVVAILGILKAGGAYLPLDPALPKERLSFMVQDAGATVVLAQERLVELLSEVAPALVSMDTGWPEIAQQLQENPDGNSGGENLAYVIYTSGSTGKPNGVMIQHRSVHNLATALHQAIYASHPGERFRLGLNSSISFDASLQRLVMALYGHVLYIIPQETRQDGEALLEYLRINRLDGIDCVPAQLKLLLTAGLLDGSGWTPSMVTSGGEAIDETTWRRLTSAKATDFFNMYGPTECTVDSTIGLVGKVGERPTIGRPLANVRAYILNRYLEPVPIGVPGELHIGGAGVGRGYLNHPGLTAERFIPDPFSNEPGVRLYRTGDLVRYLPDGNIEFLGRIDHQVKVRGFRIELGEIEAVLSQHPAVGEAVVLAREDVRGEKRLVAYLVPNQVPVPETGHLRAFLTSKLPEYMVPAVYVMLETLPLTPSGKVARSALPAPDWSRRELEQVFVAPRTPVEEVLAGIWVQVLGIETVGIHDSFFDLGGHSLLAVRLIARVNKAFGTDLPLIALFQAPTVEQLAVLLGGDEAQEPGAFSSLVNMQSGGTKPPLFVLPGNLGNVFTDLGYVARHLGPDQPFYGLQDGLGRPARIEDLAAHYVEEIRRVRPAGPYFLAGICSGAVVAFEMAQLLQAQGQEVSFLAMVDPSPIHEQRLGTYIGFGRSVLRRFGRRLGHHAQEVAQQHSADQGAYLRLKMKVVANGWAIVRYTPRPYPGRIDLLLTEESLQSPESWQLRWQEFALEGAEIHHIPGNHAAIVGLGETPIEEAYMQVVAETMAACIDKSLSDG